MPAPTSAATDQIQILLKQINMNVSHIMMKEFYEYPVTVHQLHIMKMIRKNPSINLKSLCNDLSLSKSSLSSTINKLVIDGYVIRNENPSDRRNVDILLSDKGEEILKSSMQKARKVFSSLTASLSQSDLDDMIKSFTKLNGAIENALHSKCEVKKEK